MGTPFRKRGKARRRIKAAHYMTDGDVRRWWAQMKDRPAPRCGFGDPGQAVYRAGSGDGRVYLGRVRG